MLYGFFIRKNFVVSSRANLNNTGLMYPDAYLLYNL